MNQFAIIHTCTTVSILHIIYVSHLFYGNMCRAHIPRMPQNIATQTQYTHTISVRGTRIRTRVHDFPKEYVKQAERA